MTKELTQEKNNIANYMVEVRKKIVGTSPLELADQIVDLYGLIGQGDFKQKRGVAYFSIEGLPNPPHIEVKKTGKKSYSIRTNLHAIYEHKLSELEEQLALEKREN